MTTKIRPSVIPLPIIDLKIKRIIDSVFEKSVDENNSGPMTILEIIEKFNPAFPFTVKRVQYSPQYEDPNDPYKYGLDALFEITEVNKVFVINEQNRYEETYSTNVIFDDDSIMCAQSFPDYILIK